MSNCGMIFSVRQCFMILLGSTAVINFLLISTVTAWLSMILLVQRTIYNAVMPWGFDFGFWMRAQKGFTWGRLGCLPVFRVPHRQMSWSHLSDAAIFFSLPCFVLCFFCFYSVGQRRARGAAEWGLELEYFRNFVTNKHNIQSSPPDKLTEVTYWDLWSCDRYDFR